MGAAYSTNQLLGAATLDRLHHRSEVIVRDGSSYRSRQIGSKNKEIQEVKNTKDYGT